ncbi:MAG: hypothetical protein D3923_14290 [Candidatus Electrothrix sp. AR3]|nr:hypothetical protein [Candidatus Electrothrix sp. AR3]
MQLRIVIRIKGHLRNFVGIDRVVLIRFRAGMRMRKGCFVRSKKNGCDQRDQECYSVAVHNMPLNFMAVNTKGGSCAGIVIQHLAGKLTY